MPSIVSSKFHERVLQQNNPLTTLSDIHNQFVVIPINKVNWNVAFTWQRFYAFVLINKLGLVIKLKKAYTRNKTYNPVQKTNNHVISGYTIFLINKFNLVADEENKKLPNIYWAPKIQKHPSKARFIIAAPQCSVKPLSKAVISLLKHMYKQNETFNSKMYFFSNVK